MTNSQKCITIYTMSESARDLLVRGIAAARAGYAEEARWYLERVLRTDTTGEQRRDTYVWLSDISKDAASKRKHLENAFAEAPHDPDIRRRLAILDGRLNPNEMVQHGIPTAPRAEPGPSLCPECGGPLIFTADGTERQCERCGWRQGNARPYLKQPTKELLARGIAAVKAKQTREARETLEAVTRAPTSTPDQQVQAWIWLSGISSDPDEKRACLEHVLRLDPEHRAARRGLAYLNAQHPPSETKPAQPPATQAPSLQAIKSRRFVCTQCGGKMAFEAGGNWLRCTYCGQRQTLIAAMQDGALVE